MHLLKSANRYGKVNNLSEKIPYFHSLKMKRSEYVMILVDIKPMSVLGLELKV